MRTTTSIILSLALVAGASAPAFAAADGLQGRGQAAKQQKQQKQKPPKAQKAPKGQKAQGAQKQAERRNGGVFDRDGHQRVIREYGRRGSLPPGLAKREALPPGLRRQLRERGTLPPGLQKHLIGVPADLSSRLPAIGRYERRYFAGDDLIVVDTRTNTIVAYVPDVWR
jgi:hypothetical protein